MKWDIDWKLHVRVATLTVEEDGLRTVKVTGVTILSSQKGESEEISVPSLKNKGLLAESPFRRKKTRNQVRMTKGLVDVQLIIVRREGACERRSSVAIAAWEQGLMQALLVREGRGPGGGGLPRHTYLLSAGASMYT